MLVFLACSGTVPNEVQQELDRLNAELNRTKKVAKEAINKVNHLEKSYQQVFQKAIACFLSIKKRQLCCELQMLFTKGIMPC